jgi:hypothetical protein
MHQTSREVLAAWIVRRWKAAKRRQQSSSMQLGDLPWDQTTYESEWASQVEYQTRPVARVSKNAGKKMIQEIMTLTNIRDAFQAELLTLNDQIAADRHSGDIDVVDLLADRTSCRTKLSKIDSAITSRYRKLDIDDQANLKKLQSSRFLTLRVNAQAIKDRLLSKLQNQKFEMERVEKAVRLGGSSGCTFPSLPA